MYEALLKNTPEYQKTAASLASPGPAALFGLPPAGRALLYAALQKDTGRILCVVTPGEAEATHFADDLKTLGLSAAVFPPRDFMLRPVEGAGREYEYRRLSVLGALAGGRLNAVCVPAEALLQYTVPQDEFQKNTLTLKPGMVYNREALVERLFAAGYVRRSQVDGPGQFSVRGRHRGHLRPRYAPARPCGVLGRRDRLSRLLRPVDPAAGRCAGKDLSFSRP